MQPPIQIQLTISELSKIAEKVPTFYKRGRLARLHIASYLRALNFMHLGMRLDYI